MFSAPTAFEVRLRCLRFRVAQPTKRAYRFCRPNSLYRITQHSCVRSVQTYVRASSFPGHLCADWLVDSCTRSITKLVVRSVAQKGMLARTSVLNLKALCTMSSLVIVTCSSNHHGQQPGKISTVLCTWPGVFLPALSLSLPVPLSS